MVQIIVGNAIEELMDSRLGCSAREAIFLRLTIVIPIEAFSVLNG